MTPEERKEKKARVLLAQLYKENMTTEEKIRMLNTPYAQLPEHLKPGMTKSPQTFNFVRLTHQNIGQQRETFAARLIRYRKKYNLSQEKFIDICNEYAQRFDAPGIDTERPLRTRITKRDMVNYENFNVCPKIDKMTLIAEATGYSIDYFAGYGPASRRRR